MSDSTRREGTDGQPYQQEAVGSGRHRRLPLSQLANLAVQAREREEKAGFVGEPENFERYVKMAWTGDLEAAEAERKKADDWLNEFCEKADPRLLGWIGRMSVFTGFQLEPWKAWDDFRASVPTEIREAIDRLADCDPGPQPPRA